jgi:hypothetical protein
MLNDVAEFVHSAGDKGVLESQKWSTLNSGYRDVATSQINRLTKRCGSRRPVVPPSFSALVFLGSLQQIEEVHLRGVSLRFVNIKCPSPSDPCSSLHAKTHSEHNYEKVHCWLRLPVKQSQT